MTNGLNLFKRRCPERNVLSQFVFDSSRGISTSKLYSMFRFPDSNTVHLQCDILLCERDECGESLCVTDPDSESGRSLATQQGSPGPEEDDNRMMASTTVFVVEPGVTALGEFNTSTESGACIKLHCILDSILSEIIPNKVEQRLLYAPSLKVFSIFMNLCLVPTPPPVLMFVFGNFGFTCGETQDAGGHSFTVAQSCCSHGCDITRNCHLLTAL